MGLVSVVEPVPDLPVADADVSGDVFGAVGVADGLEDGQDKLPPAVGLRVGVGGSVVGGVGNFASGAFQEAVGFFADERGKGRGGADGASTELAVGAGSGWGAVGAEGFVFRPVAVGVEYLADGA